MSDFVKDAVRPHSISSFESKQSASDKLRILSARGESGSRGEGGGVQGGEQAALLGDAFAEVFAAMSITSPPPVSSPQVSPPAEASSDPSVGERVTESSSEEHELADDSSVENDSDDETVQLVAGEVQEFIVETNSVSTDSEVAALVGEQADDASQNELVEAAQESLKSQEAIPVEVAQAVSAQDHLESSIENEPSEDRNRETGQETDLVLPNEIESSASVSKTLPLTDQSSVSASTDSGTELASTELGQATPDQSGEESQSQGRRRYTHDDKPGVASESRSSSQAVDQIAESGQESSVATAIRSLDSAAEAPTPVRQPSTPVVSSAGASAALSAVKGAVSAGSPSSGHASNQGAKSTAGLQPSGQPNHGLAEKSGKPAEKGATKTDTLTRIKLVQRVSRAFQHLGPEGGVVRLRLAPAELGTVRVEMRIQQKKVEARVVAETEAAGSALREHLPELRARLEAHGMQVESLEVETESGDGSSSSFLDHRSQDDHHQGHSTRQSRPRTKLARPVVPAPVSQQGVSLTSTGGVDIRF